MSNLGYMDDNGERVDLGPRSVSETEQNRINMELERLAYDPAPRTHHAVGPVGAVTIPEE